jgi:hypothetical protein
MRIRLWAGVTGSCARAQALPQLLKHDQWDWHLHATTHDAPLADRMGPEAAIALVDVIRSKEMDRMLGARRMTATRRCSTLAGTGPSDTATPETCANRAHVAGVSGAPRQRRVISASGG